MKKNSPFVTSGIRLGTPAMTTRGLKEDDFRLIGKLIIQTLKKERDPEEIKKEVLELNSRFPLYK